MHRIVPTDPGLSIDTTKASPPPRVLSANSTNVRFGKRPSPLRRRAYRSRRCRSSATGRPVPIRRSRAGQEPDVNDEADQTELRPLSADELAAEGVTALPDKEVASILDLNADLNLGLGLAAPVDLGVAANANVA